MTQTKVEASGLSGDFFDTSLGQRAGVFKETYAEHFPNNLVWEPWLRFHLSPYCVEDLAQNPDPSVKRGRKASPDGSLPTYTRSSGNLCLGVKAHMVQIEVVFHQRPLAASRRDAGNDGAAGKRGAGEDGRHCAGSSREAIQCCEGG